MSQELDKAITEAKAIADELKPIDEAYTAAIKTAQSLRDRRKQLWGALCDARSRAIQLFNDEKLPREPEGW